MMQTFPNNEVHSVFNSLRFAKITAKALFQSYRAREPLTALVVNDAEGATLALHAGIEILVVGFSDGGLRTKPTHLSATLDDAAEAVWQVRQANRYAYLIADIPYECYVNGHDLTRVAKALMEAGAEAVKIEGGKEILDLVKELVDHQIPTVAHVGYTPKTETVVRTKAAFKSELTQLRELTEALQNAGASAIVFEMVKMESAAYLTERLTIPTIGIFSGGGTSGQVLVLDDILDRTVFVPEKFPKGKPKALGSWQGSDLERVNEFYTQVKQRDFPLRTTLCAEKKDETLSQWISVGGRHET